MRQGLSLLLKFRLGQFLVQEMIASGMGVTQSVRRGATAMRFAVPNALNRYRADTFETKEPETLKWIEAIPTNDVVWDVGANIGLYAIYAAKTRNARVFAFEPSVFNLELLARNIVLNGLQSAVTIVPVAFSDKAGPNLFQMTSTDWGGALSTFGEGFDQNGQMMNGVFEYQTVGISMDDTVPSLGIPPPNHLKIDVDGIEHFILRGGEAVLAGVSSVLIEINDGFEAQAQESVQHLERAGLQLLKKCDLGVAGQYNQWWVRSKPADT